MKNKSGRFYSIIGWVLIIIGIVGIALSFVVIGNTLNHGKLDNFNQYLHFEATVRSNVILGYISVIGGILCLGVSKIIKLIINKD